MNQASLTESPHLQHARRVIALAKNNVATKKGGPFAAIIVDPKTNTVIAEATNEVLANHDPTAHAEVNAIRIATQKLQHFELKNLILYTSCEPCPMCLGAIYWARLQEVIFCADRKDAAHAGFDDSFIYDEISLSPLNRKIPMRQFNDPSSREPFQEWIRFEQKIEY